MSSFEVTLHWIYVAIMFGSAISFQMMARSPHGVPSYKYLIHTFVVVWSGLAYSAIALGQGSVEANGQTVYLARYVDWVVSTPLLLLSLNLTGKFYLKVEGAITAGLLGTQAIMIITGAIAELSAADQKWFWYAVGCVALIIVLYLMWGPLRQKAESQNRHVAYAYRKSALFLTIQWLAYPTVWLLGYMGLNMINSSTTTFLFVLLPIISKAVFGFYNLSLLRAMPKEDVKP